jgi:glycosyltransferase involved in cell wall biosynthesis
MITPDEFQEKMMNAKKLLDPESVVVTYHSFETQRSSLPFVSVVIPCFNEERFIAKVLQNLASQYERERYEIVVVDGMSTDGTRKVIANFAAQNRDITVRVIDNPARVIPVAVNLGIREAQGEIIIRMDAHSVPSVNYVQRCVELVREDKAAVVGMPWHIKPGRDSVVARAIALAVAHPFGVGDAKYRLANVSARLVDCVPFGAFKKALWEELGGFNEALLTNEDYEFYYRVRSGGRKILLDTAAHCDYFARSSLAELAKQYFRYGHWKAQMVKLHPSSIRLRQLAAPSSVAYASLTVLLGLFWPRGFWLLLPLVALYVLLAAIIAFRLAWNDGDWKLIFIVPLVFFVIHVVWGSSFLLGLVRSPRGPGRVAKASA